MRPNRLNFSLMLLAVSALVAGCSSPPSREAAADDEKPAAAVIAPKATQPADRKSTDENIGDAVNDHLNIYFASGSSLISGAEKEKLHGHALRLKEDADLLVTLVGHADDSGSRSYNVAITDARVLVVNKLLRSSGVPARQIRRNVSGHRQASNCKTAACQQKLRRVELIFSMR